MSANRENHGGSGLGVSSCSPCPDCAHDIPGEISRGGGVYSLCPSCFGKGEIDGTEGAGTTLARALANLKATHKKHGKPAGSII